MIPVKFFIGYIRCVCDFSEPCASRRYITISNGMQFLCVRVITSWQLLYYTCNIERGKHVVLILATCIITIAYCWLFFFCLSFPSPLHTYIFFIPLRRPISFYIWIIIVDILFDIYIKNHSLYHSVRYRHSFINIYIWCTNTFGIIILKSENINNFCDKTHWDIMYIFRYHTHFFFVVVVVERLRYSYIYIVCTYADYLNWIQL